MRKHKMIWSLAILVLTLPSSPLHVQGGSDAYDMPEKEQETIRKTFTFPAGAVHRTLEIDNVFGSINVIGSQSNDVQLVVNKTIRAESKSRLEEARRKVTLDITQEGDALRFYVNGPFRCQCQGCVSWNGDEGYVVKMDFELQIPRDIEINLKTVNSGNISVRNVTEIGRAHV